MTRALVVVILLAATRIAAAQPTDAERLYTEGQEAYDREDYATALDRWQQSYELSKLPALVFNIAQAHRLHGDCRAAVDSYRKFIALEPSAAERPDAEGFIRELEPKCPAPVVPPARVEPPRVTPPGGRHVDTPPPAHPGRGKRWLGLGSGAVGVGMVVLGVIAGREAQRLGDEVAADCDNNGCDFDAIRDKDADGRAAERRQYVFYGVGAAALVTGGVLYWLGTRDAERAPVAVVPRADGAMVSWSGRW